ncbi:MAG: hypothetical protein EBV92_09530, partial [Betaproteobacteria bacterium]|nr:hypothetical protein [Betaproteobacteria bacterium]
MGRKSGAFGCGRPRPSGEIDDKTDRIGTRNLEGPGNHIAGIIADSGILGGWRGGIVRGEELPRREGGSIRGDKVVAGISDRAGSGKAGGLNRSNRIVAGRAVAPIDGGIFSQK